jgi:hypothetical protein
MSSSRSQRLKNGLIIGGCIGVIYATMGFLVENIDYYFFGGRVQTARDLSLPYIPLTYDSLITGLISQFWIWLILVVVSTLLGFVAGALSSNKTMNEKNHIRIP